MNRILSVMALVTGLFGLVGCATLPEAARESLQTATTHYVRGETREALTRLNPIIAEHPTAAEIGEAHYVRGLCLASMGQLPPAREDFRKAIDASRREDLTARAQASLAAIEYRQQNWPVAADLFGDSLPKLPDRAPKDKLLYHAGIAMRRAGRWSDGQQQFAQILMRFRDRSIASAARRQASWPHEHFSIQVGSFDSTTNADQRVRELSASRVDAFFEFRGDDSGGRWVVMTGRYTRYAQAVQDLGRIRAVQADAFIIP